MRVRMNVELSGTRDGQDWPAKGGVVDLPEDQAQHLVAGGLASVDDSKVEAAKVDTEPDSNSRKTTVPRKASAAVKKGK